MFGNWGEASEATNKVVDMLAASRARIAEHTTSRRGDKRTEEGVSALTVSQIRETIAVAAVRAAA